MPQSKKISKSVLQSLKAMKTKWDEHYNRYYWLNLSSNNRISFRRCIPLLFPNNWLRNVVTANFSLSSTNSKRFSLISNSQNFLGNRCFRCLIQSWRRDDRPWSILSSIVSFLLPYSFATVVLNLFSDRAPSSIWK